MTATAGLVASGSLLLRAAAAADEVGLRLVRASPKGDDRLLLALRTAGGEEVAGQWFADAERCASVARRTVDASVPRAVTAYDGLLVQRDGADRRLPRLHRLVTGGASLVAHRPERRGVVRLPGGDYVKVLPADRVDGIVATLRTAAGWPGVEVPRVVAADPVAGTVSLAALPGRTLHDLLSDAGATRGGELRDLGLAVGAAVAQLHAVPVTDDVAAHTMADEVAVTRRWLDLAARLAGLPIEPEALLRPVLRRVAAHRPGHAAVLHRDLHDKQLLIDRTAGVGVLDLDLLAVGEPALDLANLLVHLELRAHQRLLPGSRARALADAVLEGYAPDPEVRAGLALHARLTRLRLAAVYAFRPASAAAAHRLLTDPMLEELS